AGAVAPGAAATSVCPAARSGAAPLATGYQRDAYRSLVRPGDRLEPAPPVAAEPGAGGLLTRPGDLVRLLLALGDGALLSTASRTALERSGGPLRRAGRGGARLLWHDGGGAGFSSLLRLDPDLGVAAVAMTNRCSAGPELGDLLDAALAPWLDDAGATAAPRSAVPAAEAGTYRGSGGPLHLAAGRLRTPAGDVPLRAHGRACWIQAHGPWSDHLLRAVVDTGGPWELRAGPVRWPRADLCAALHRDGAAPPAPGTHRAGRYRHPVLGDVWLHARPEGLTISFWYGEEVLLERTGPRTWRPAGGLFAGEPLELGPGDRLKTGGRKLARI
ncbi:MAG TPA: serine hydrolase, partial [Thermoanaerobaculia bacterium]|nr:serine hydrolase [Thermoanaerobaculia bacterium]